MDMVALIREENERNPKPREPVSAWLGRHSDLWHDGSRDTCEHCQMMIHYFGPMPPLEEMRGALAIDNTTRSSYTKTPIPNRLRKQVFERDGYRCVICGDWHDLHADHIFPERKGGEATLENMQTLCKSCNSRKGARI